MAFGPTTIQPPATLNCRATVCEVDTSGTDHRDNEVRGMNADHRRDLIEWNEAHQ